MGKTLTTTAGGQPAFGSRLLSAFAIVAALLAATVSSASAQTSDLRDPVYGSGVTAGDPIATRNFPDPSIMRVGRNFWAYSTSSTGADPRNIGVMKTPNLANWSFPGGGLGPAEAMPAPPTWAWSVAEGGEFWAPTVAKFSDKYVMYFGARSRVTAASSPTWCIGYAVASKPQGPFVGGSQPLFCRIEGASVTGNALRNNGAIDPQIYRDRDGSMYLHWKAENNHVQLWGAKLAANGRSVASAPAAMVPMDGYDRSAWEYSNRLGFTILENPSMDYDPSTNSYVLFYSGGEWQDSSYSTGYARCATPLGPCERVTVSKPWLVGNTKRIGPGGLSVFHDAKGNAFAAFHSWQAGKENTSTGRALHIEPLTYVNGVPKLANRKPVGKLTVSNTRNGSTVFKGWALDPDIGAKIKVQLRRDGKVIKTVTAGKPKPRASKAYPHAGSRRGFVLKTAAAPGRYCIFALDDRTNKPKRLACRTIR